MQIRLVLFLREAGLDMTVDRRGLLFTSSFTSGLERHVTVRDILLFTSSFTSGLERHVTVRDILLLTSDLETCYNQGYTPLHFRPRDMLQSGIYSSSFPS
jgi:hypothetical protein